MKQRLLLGLASLFLFGACASEGQLVDEVKVYKSAGGLQCEPESGVPLAEMEAELTDAGIQVLCAQEANDGVARITMCGASDGSINVYTIDGADLPGAEALGFASVDVLPEYRDEVCSESRNEEGGRE